MRNKQSGMTGIGILAVVSLVAIISYGIFILVPIYLETTKVDTIMDDMVTEFSGQPVTAGKIRGQIDKRLNIETVNSITSQDFVIKPVNRNYQINVAYDASVRYFGNLHLLVKYDKTVEIPQ